MVIERNKNIYGCLDSNIGLKLESRKDYNNEDNGEDSKKIDWGLIFMTLHNRNFSHEEILKLSYPQFNAYMNNISDALSYNVVIPYLGSGEDKAQEEEIQSKEELNTIIAMMNSQLT